MSLKEHLLNGWLNIVFLQEKLLTYSWESNTSCLCQICWNKLFLVKSQVAVLESIIYPVLSLTKAVTKWEGLKFFLVAMVFFPAGPSYFLMALVQRVLLFLVAMQICFKQKLSNTPMFTSISVIVLKQNSFSCSIPIPNPL